MITKFLLLLVLVTSALIILQSQLSYFSVTNTEKPTRTRHHHVSSDSSLASYLRQQYFQNNSSISYVDCDRFFDNNLESFEEYNNSGRVTLDEDFPLDMSCDAINSRLLVMSDPKKQKYTYAVARNVYMNYPLQELLLFPSYSPYNSYCYAIDIKSNTTFIENLRKLSECLPNFHVLEELFEFDSSGFNQNTAHQQCVSVLLQNKWDYVLYLQNHDVILRNNHEMSLLIEHLNGSLIVENKDPFGERVPQEVDFSPRALKLFKNESQWTSEQLDTLLEIRKSSVHVFLSRPFVKFVDKNLNLDGLIYAFNNQSIYGNDEMLMATLVANTFLGLPYQTNDTCVDLFPFRYVQWTMGHTCLSDLTRHYLCMLGVEYLPILKKSTHIFANKVWPSFDISPIICLAEKMHQRRTHKKVISNLMPYDSCRTKS